jgi:uncharacterized membrane protein YphA (DoxX/SURF4 family)
MSMESAFVEKKSPARIVTVIARVLMGLVFFVFGLNGFLKFMPMPPKLPDLIEAFIASGYMMPLIAGTQVVSGALLLANRFVPLALALIAPVVVNIFLFHIYIDPQGLVIAIVVCALELWLAWSYRAAFAPMLAAKVTPNR